jgi:type IX secretion system substrate protein
MAKFLLLLVIATSCYSPKVNGQCPPTTQAIEVADPSCAGGCRVNLYNWPDGATVYVFDESAAPAVLITSTIMSGSFGDGFLSSDSVCVPCNVPVAATSQVFNQAGCLLFATPVLAVLLNHFSVASSLEGNTISWTVNFEQQNVTYVLQRSSDCKTFSNIAALKGLGYGDVAKDYSYNDPVLSQGNYCYRLKAIESNGTITYSNTISTGGVPGISTEVYPNPVTGNSFKMNIPTDQLPALVNIYTMQGQLVYSGEITEPVSTITTSLPSGIYAVKITGNNSSSTVVKLIEQ